MGFQLKTVSSCSDANSKIGKRGSEEGKPVGDGSHKASTEKKNQYPL